MGLEYRMSKKISPSSRPRSKKISGGRIGCIVYLPKEEVADIDAKADIAGMSRSSVISNIYYLGKQSQNINEG